VSLLSDHAHLGLQ